VFDAAANLRAVLDQTGYATAVLGGKNRPKNSLFPIADDEPGLKVLIGRKRSKDLPPEILDLFCGFKPYKGGNDAIWALNKLANSKKHVSLVPVQLGAAWAGGKMTLRDPGEPRTARVALEWDRDKNELAMVRGPLDLEIRLNATLAFSILFDPAHEVIGGQHPVAALRTMAREVERILMATEAECRRIGLIR
jgi:hypothetical protein